MRNGMMRRFIVVVALLFVAGPVCAEIALPSVIGDHMVLQQGKKAPIWGWASPGEAVTVTMGGKSLSTEACAKGRWKVVLGRLKAGGPYTMTIAGPNNTITVNDILVGEVWVCSGQSNMQWPVSASRDADQEIAAADYPEIRLFSVERKVAETPQEECTAAWSVCTPETVPAFSAVGYFFGRELYQALGVPVGLVHTSWGGTPSEAWTSLPALESDPAAKPLLAYWDKVLADWPETKKTYDAQVDAWKAQVEKAKAAGKDAPRKPRMPRNPEHPHRPASLYNAMINPLRPFAIQGAIWYQGESNAGRAFQYRSLFPLMIEDWRAAWGQGDFSFYFVQLANFRERQAEPVEDAWAELREAQTMTLALKNTGMAVIIDIGEAGNIHPKNKQDVGKRLALNALAKDYGKRIPYSGPMYRSMRRKGNAIVLSFKHAKGGLVAKGGALKGFAIAGANRKFVWADATIKGKKVVVQSDVVSDPVAVRYAWGTNPACNLYNGADLPASPFRTDDWPGITVSAGTP